MNAVEMESVWFQQMYNLLLLILPMTNTSIAMYIPCHSAMIFIIMQT